MSTRQHQTPMAECGELIELQPLKKKIGFQIASSFSGIKRALVALAKDNGVQMFVERTLLVINSTPMDSQFASTTPGVSLAVHGHDVNLGHFTDALQHCSVDAYVVVPIDSPPQNSIYGSDSGILPTQLKYSYRNGTDALLLRLHRENSSGQDFAVPDFSEKASEWASSQNSSRESLQSKNAKIRFVRELATSAVEFAAGNTAGAVKRLGDSANELGDVLSKKSILVTVTIAGSRSTQLWLNHGTFTIDAFMTIWQEHLRQIRMIDHRDVVYRVVELKTNNSWTEVESVVVGGAHSGVNEYYACTVANIKRDQGYFPILPENSSGSVCQPATEQPLESVIAAGQSRPQLTSEQFFELEKLKIEKAAESDVAKVRVAADMQIRMANPQADMLHRKMQFFSQLTSQNIPIQDAIVAVEAITAEKTS
jgi:hypothetical protein